MQLKNPIKKYQHYFQHKTAPRVGKIVLCRPRGGLNDTLGQIKKCYLYAKKYRRNLWVDTRRSGFQDCFGNYFAADDDFHFGTPVGKICDGLSVFPPFLKHRADSYQTVFNELGYVDTETGKPLTFNFKTDYDEDLLVHEQCGRGRKNSWILARMRLREKIKNDIRSIIENLGRYDAVHIRNTDRITDYQKLFRKIKRKINGRIVVCTDDFTCQQDAKKFWGERLIIVHSLPDLGGQTLHDHKFENEEHRREINFWTLADLFILASAQKLYYGYSANSEGKGRARSGYSSLALQLHKKPEIVRRLLG